MKERLRTRTWPVFLAGLGSLLALLFLPGITALRRADEIYRDIRTIQSAQQQTQQSLAQIERSLYLISIAVREWLLDSASEPDSHYRTTVQESRESIARELESLKKQAGGIGARHFQQLETELQAYWRTLAPVFEWNSQQRAARGLFFLRDQQRPRRQSILAIASTISGLIEGSQQRQYDALNESQQNFREDLQRIVAIAFLIGMVITGGSILRISTLEGRAESQRRQAEEDEERLRHLSMQLMHAQEAERKSLSRELHDEVGQMLTALRMEIAALDRSRQDEAVFAEHAAGARSLAEQSLRAVRDLAVGLRPSVLDLGLAPALQWQARQFSRASGIRVNVEVDGEFDGLPDEHSTCIYRVVQESLTNAGKHAEAKQVHVRLRGERERLELSVEDDGKGFAVRNASASGLGLAGMQERVREIGGLLKIESQPGRGTHLHVFLNIPAHISK